MSTIDAQAGLELVRRRRRALGVPDPLELVRQRREALGLVEEQPPRRSIAGEIGVGVVRGALRLPAQGAQAGAAAASAVESVVGDTAVTNFVQDYGSTLSHLTELAVGPGFGIEADPKRPYSAAIGEGIPQIGMAVAAAAPTAGASLPASIAIFAGTSAGPVVGQVYDAAVRETGNERKAALEAAIAGGITAGTSVLPGAAILGKVPAGKRIVASAAARAVGRFGTRAAAEGTQEYVEGFGQEITREMVRRGRDLTPEMVTDALTNPERMVEFVAGGVLGGPAGVAVDVGRMGGAGRQAGITPENRPARIVPTEPETTPQAAVPQPDIVTPESDVPADIEPSVTGGGTPQTASARDLSGATFAELISIAEPMGIDPRKSRRRLVQAIEEADAASVAPVEGVAETPAATGEVEGVGEGTFQVAGEELTASQVREVAAAVRVRNRGPIEPILEAVGKAEGVDAAIADVVGRTPPAGSLSQKTIDFARERRRQAVERIKARRSPTEGGRQGGATTLPDDLVDVAIVVGATIIEGAGVTAQKLGEVVKTHIPDADRETVARVVEAGRDVARSMQRGRTGLGTKTVVRLTTGQRDLSAKVPTTEAQALRRRLRTEEKAARTAHRQAAKENRAKLRQRLDEVNAAFESRRRAEGARVLKRSLKAQERAGVAGARLERDSIAGIQKQVQRMVQENLPIDQRGRFLTDLRTARTLGDLGTIVEKIRRNLARTEGTVSLKRVRRYAGTIKGGRTVLAKRAKETTDDRRTRLSAIAGEAAALAETLKARRPEGEKLDASVLETSAAKLEELAREAAEIITVHEWETLEFKADRQRTLIQHVVALQENVRKVRPPSKDALAKPEQDVEVAAWKAFIDGRLDLSNTLNMAEGGDGVAHGLFVTRGREARDRYMGIVRDAQKAVDEAVRRAGFSSLGEAQVKLSGALGFNEADRRTFKLGEREIELTLGEALHLAAMDESTVRVLDSGGKVQLDRGKTREPWHLPLEDLFNVRIALDPKLHQLARDLKAVHRTLWKDAQQVHRRLKGWEAVTVDDHWPRARNLQFRREANVPGLENPVPIAELEQMGFFKERVPDTRTPIIIRDALTTSMQHIDALARVIAMAEWQRDVNLLLSNEQVVNTLSERFGNKIVDTMKRYTLAAVGLDQFQERSTTSKWVNRANRNLGLALLSLNPSTHLKIMVGGMLRAAGYLDARVVRDGLAGMWSVKMADLTDRSGYFWGRYRGDVFRRFSPVDGHGQDLLDGQTARQSLRALAGGLKGLAAGSPLARRRAAAQIGKSWTKLNQSIRALDFSDSLAARMAFAGHIAESKRLHAGWSLDQHKDWAAQKASELMRDTQNSSDPLDLSTGPMRNRDSIATPFLLFTSDPLKAHNRIIRAHRQSKAGITGAREKAIAAEAANLVWGRLAGAGFWLGIATLGAVLGDNEDEKARVKEQARDLDYWLWGLAADAAGTAVPVFGDRLFAVIEQHFTGRWRPGGVIDAPVLEIVNDAGESISAMGGAVRKAATGEEGAIVAFVEGLGDAAESFGALAGFAGTPLVRHISTIWKKANADRPFVPMRVSELRSERNKLNGKGVANLTPAERQRRTQLNRFYRTVDQPHMARMKTARESGDDQAWRKALDELLAKTRAFDQDD